VGTVPTLIVPRWMENLRHHSLVAWQRA